MAIIKTNSLTKYYGKIRGIENVDLEVREGEIFGFIGPNGAGKSTTIRTLLNFIFPTSGSATVFGLDIVRHSREIRARVGYLPGEVNYYDDMTAGELLAYSARFYNKDCSKRIRELTELFDLDPEKKIHSLSLGNKKKVAIIQCLLHEPRLLILDEPTSGLDPLMQRHFFEILQEENKKGVTVFFSSHVLSEVERLCHRVAIIKNGRILRLEEMDRLRGSQFLKVTLTMKDPASAPPDVPGIIHSEQDNGTWRLLFNGDINQLVQELARYELLRLHLEEPPLEEVFMHYYEKEESR
ncbi:MAG: ABC transporter ATP-binding protein [Firmicutes bacterium]|nr:ABC transporter ATP-binding protein [Bacillota bacterium]HOB34862.1 ABC transporter ATP-binding protein [Bacillota bacterium]HPZ90394.1 ABC transporter ATP-binding protein [Bacillota bacterium]HQE02492.1 ABC transporter ATP-binding protein [Bacillota bacterium]